MIDHWNVEEVRYETGLSPNQFTPYARVTIFTRSNITYAMMITPTKLDPKCLILKPLFGHLERKCREWLELSKSAQKIVVGGNVLVESQRKTN